MATSGSAFHVCWGPDVQLSLTDVLSPGRWQAGVLVESEAHTVAAAMPKVLL